MSRARIVFVAALAALVALAAAGCAHTGSSGAFSYNFLDNQAADTAAVVAHLPASAAPSRPTNATGRPLVVAATHGDHRGVLAWDVEGNRALWTTPLDVLTRPEILGDVVLTSAREPTGGSTSREEVYALALSDGHVLWHDDAHELTFVGGSRGGDTIVFAESVGVSGGARRVGHLHAVDAHTGRVKWEHEVQGVFGRPAVAGGYAFVPWERQNIAILDMRTGLERARLRSTDDVISFVDAEPQGIFYGATNLYRFDARSASGKRTGSTHTATPIADAPGEPLMQTDGFLPAPGTRSARGRIALQYAVAPGQGPIRFENDEVYYVNFRYVFAFDTQGVAKWVRMLPAAVARSQAFAHGLFTVSEDGSMHYLDAATGADRWSAETGTELGSVALDVDGFDPAPAAAPAARPLREELNEVILDPDNRLVPARAYAIQILAKDPTPEVSRDLLDLYAQRSMPRALREAIGAAMRTRRTGTEFLVQALSRHYDFLEGTEAPPLALIVPSLVEAHDASAVPGLIEQMMDHETPADVLPSVVGAIAQLGDAHVVPALETFLVLYHADSTFRENPQALALAAEGIFRLGGTEGRELLTKLSAETSTPEALATAMRGFFESETRAAEATARSEQQAAERARVEAARQAEEALPARLTQVQVNQAFADHADDVRACVADELTRNPRLAQVRFLFILHSDGSPHDFTFAPNTPQFVQCMTPKLAALTFPRFRQTRQRAEFRVAIRGGVIGDSGAPPAGGGGATTSRGDSDALSVLPPDAPWYDRVRARSEVAGLLGPNTPPPPGLLPWWVRRAAPVAVSTDQGPTQTGNGNAGTGGGNQTATQTGGNQTGTHTGNQTQTGGGNQGTQTGSGAGTGNAGTGNAGTGSQTPWWMQGNEGGAAPPPPQQPPPSTETPVSPTPPPAAPPPPANGRGRRGRNAPPPPTEPPAAPTPPPAAPTPPAPPAQPWWLPNQ